MSRKTPEQISKNMKAVKYKDSAIEKILRIELWHRGMRYRKNVKDIFGKPDIVFIKKKKEIKNRRKSGGRKRKRIRLSVQAVTAAFLRVP